MNSVPITARPGSPPTWSLQHFILDIMFLKYALLLSSVTQLQPHSPDPTAPSQAALSLKCQVIPGPTLAFVSQLTHFPRAMHYAPVPSAATYKLTIPKLCLLQISTACHLGPPCLKWKSKANVSSPLGFLLDFRSQFLPSPTTWLSNLQSLIHSYSSELLQEPPSMAPPLPVLLSSGSFSPAVTNVTLTLSLGSSHLQYGVPVFSHGPWAIHGRPLAGPPTLCLS